MSNIRISSLTSPVDRGDGIFRANVAEPSLTNEQTEAAMKALYSTHLVDDYPKLERQFVDPPIAGQRFGLISFSPSKGATPDKDGFFGFAKLRGHYDSEQEARERSEFVLKTVDSYHPINIYHVGRPVPITVQGDRYSASNTTIDLQNTIKNTISEDVRMKREKEREEIQQMKAREQELVDQRKPDYQPDPFDTYTTLRVKKAQLVWTYDKTQKQLEKIKESIIATRAEIAKMDEENADYSKEHMKRYMDARRAAGIPDEGNTTENYMRFLVEDIDLGF